MSYDTQKLLEFEKILNRISLFAHSPATILLLQTLSPLREREEIELRFARIDEIRSLAASGIRLPLAPFEEIKEILELARPEGSTLSPGELSQLMPLLKVSQDLATLFGYRTDIPLLKELAHDVQGFPDILEPLERTIAPDGGILDTASDLLFNLRKSHRNLVSRIRKRLEEIVRERATAIFLQDDFITQRNGRWVIPVRMDSKGMVPGVVHDVSRTGETAFMEPIEVIAMVNELENIGAEEKAEQIRILKEITGWIREDSNLILADFEAVVRLDLLNSLASFATLIDASVPRMTDEMFLKIESGCHPLLLLFHKERSGRSVVPLDLEIGGSSGTRTLLITGPNTGGKTIAIKTVGVLTLMAQSGIPVPAGKNSVFPVPAAVSADIGDDQSIEESLSTFSSHIRKIVKILHKADERTIVLLDELGTGTDPVQGGAIACAVLADLASKGCMVLATTHLIDIVAFVQKSQNMINGAMEFDRSTLAPGYRLTIGEPGQSHALDIARQCGLPERIIVTAGNMVGRMESEFHSLLAELKETRMRNDSLHGELLRREAGIAEKERSVEEALCSAGTRLREAREKGIISAKELVNTTKAELNRILEEAKRERSRKSAGALAAVEEKLVTELEQIRPKSVIQPEAIEPGSKVFVTALGHNATVLAVDKNQKRLRLHAGSMEIELPFSAVSSPLETTSDKRDNKRSRRHHEPDVERELNVIGLRVEEALCAVDKFLDNCSLTGTREVRIIHGIGTGSLMRGVREHLARSPQVEVFRKGENFEGGDGITVVTLNN
jgi:DNA mismatch repair protein MutS2